MIATPVIVTERLRLRARTPDDAEGLFPTLADPAWMTWWSHPPATSIEEVRADFAADRAPWRCWAITRGDDDRAIGFVGAGEKRQGKVSEIGYLLEPAASGAGIAREAVGAVIGQLFAEGQRRVIADIDPDNAASIALVERLGFTLEGRMRAEWETHIGVRDSLIYGLLAMEWRARVACG